jgi:hypothetical protein
MLWSFSMVWEAYFASSFEVSIEFSVISQIFLVSLRGRWKTRNKIRSLVSNFKWSFRFFSLFFYKWTTKIFQKFFQKFNFKFCNHKTFKWKFYFYQKIPEVDYE